MTDTGLFTQNALLTLRHAQGWRFTHHGSAADSLRVPLGAIAVVLGGLLAGNPVDAQYVVGSDGGTGVAFAF